MATLVDKELHEARSTEVWRTTFWPLRRPVAVNRTPPPDSISIPFNPGRENKSLKLVAAAASPRRGKTPKISWRVRKSELCV